MTITIGRRRNALRPYTSWSMVAQNPTYEKITSTAPKSATKMAESSLSEEQIEELKEERATVTRQTMEWFNSVNVRILRLRTGDHVAAQTTRTRCALCNINNRHNVGGKEPNTKCTTCGVHLFMDSSPWRDSCWKAWHGEDQLYQRINRHPDSRKFK